MRRSLLLTMLVLAVLPASASARPADRGLRQTFPVASRLCARADAGRLPKRLAASADQVKAACATLHAASTSAQSDLNTTFTPLAQQAGQAIATARSTCQAALASRDRAACKAARDQARQTLAGLRAQLRPALQAYRAAVSAARKAFWTTIHGLRGGAGVAGDSGATASDGAPALPDDGTS
jgi:hypothetical protein